MKQLLGLLPGVGSMMKDVHIEDKQLDKVEAMISSMTKKERAAPSLINNARRRRISTGSGTQQEEVGAMVKQFEMVSKLTKSMATMSAADRVKAVKGMGKDGMSQLPGMAGLPGMRNKGSTAAPSIKDKFKKRKK
jgi:signal recognition particle subunit SRP54